MQTYVNGSKPQAIQTTPAIEGVDPRGDLDSWDDAIAALDLALRDAADARLSLDKLHRTLEAIEAGHILVIEGSNAEQRKARLSLALGDDAQYQQTIRAIDTCRTHLLDAERRVQVSKERCRLLRAGLELGRDG